MIRHQEQHVGVLSGGAQVSVPGRVSPALWMFLSTCLVRQSLDGSLGWAPWEWQWSRPSRSSLQSFLVPIQVQCFEITYVRGRNAHNYWLYFISVTRVW